MTESTPNDPEPSPPGHAVCLGCGCLCDDLAVEIDQGAPKALHFHCDLGRAWIERGISGIEARREVASEEEQGVEALARALLQSRSPVLFGLTQCSTETVRAALELADLVRGTLILRRSEQDRSRAAAFQNVGRVSSTLGEVKNRSDLVIYWGCDPSTTHPRHSERYTSDAAGRFLPGGREDRTVVVIDSKPTATSQAAEHFLPLAPEATLEFVTLARLILQGKPIADETLFSENGLARSAVEGFVDLCRHARYGALFFQPPAESPCYGRLLWESVLSLIRDLNELTRFVVLGLGSSGNLSGAEAALTWQSGQLLGVDYRQGFPEALESGSSLNDRLESGDLDLLLVIADPFPAELSDLARKNLSRIPCFVVGPRSHWDEQLSYQGAFATARIGIDSGGTVTRSDGVALPVRSLVSIGARSEKDWIEAILRAVEVLGEGSAGR